MTDYTQPCCQRDDMSQRWCEAGRLCPDDCTLTSPRPRTEYTRAELAAASTSDLFLRYEDCIESAGKLEQLPRRQRRQQHHMIDSLKTEARELRWELINRTETR